MDTLEKLEILADAAKYDAACSSSGVSRSSAPYSVGMASFAGCCHSFTADGRCITLLKVLLTNSCIHDCLYCPNRCSNNKPRAQFRPSELANLTIDFYKRNYIEGLFLSSGVVRSPSYTMEQMIEVLSLLRTQHRFGGYIHAKAIPGAHPDLIHKMGCYADKVSCNIELPSSRSLTALCPQKNAREVLAPLAQIAHTIHSSTPQLTDVSLPLFEQTATNPKKNITSALPALQKTTATQEKNMHISQIWRKRGRKNFAPAGQTTQLIIGATPESDKEILTLSTALYKTYELKRVFFSAYVPLNSNKALPELETPVPLRREHRLYQADWLMRYYGFSAEELFESQNDTLNLEIDPKLAWALAHLEQFPIEVNTASRTELLRVPGIGSRGANKILQARKQYKLTFADLSRLRLTMRRARHFLTCNGKRDPRSPLNPELIYHAVTHDAATSRYNKTQALRERQMSLFD